MANEEVGQRIKARRQFLRLTQADIRGRGGPTKDKVRLIEAGEVDNLSDRTKMTLGYALQWPPSAIDWLLEGDDPTTWVREVLRPGVARWDRGEHAPEEHRYVVVYDDPPPDPDVPKAAWAQTLIDGARDRMARAQSPDEDGVDLAAASGELANLPPEDQRYVVDLIRRLARERGR